RDTQETIARAGKYANTVIGFGSKKDFSLTSFYLTNSMFPLNIDELSVDNRAPIQTYTYQILNETVTKRKEKRNQVQVKPWHLSDENVITIGKERERPFHVKGMLGVSAMSFGALSKSAVKALAQGVAISGGSYMNTGEGSISAYHLSRVYEVINPHLELVDYLSEKLVHYIYEHPNCSNFEFEKPFEKGMIFHVANLVKQGVLKEKRADLILQVGSGLFGACKNNQYSEEVVLDNAMKPEVKAIELKLAQGAKVRGGKLPKE